MLIVASYITQSVCSYGYQVNYDIVLLGYSGKIDDLRNVLKDNYKQAEELCREIQ